MDQFSRSQSKHDNEFKIAFGLIEFDCTLRQEYLAKELHVYIKFCLEAFYTNNPLIYICLLVIFLAFLIAINYFKQCRITLLSSTVELFNSKISVLTLSAQTFFFKTCELAETYPNSKRIQWIYHTRRFKNKQA